MANVEIEKEESSSPPTRQVAEAYSTNDRRNSAKKFLLYFLVFVAFVVASSNGGGGGGRGGKKRKRAKALRQKAESLPETEVDKAVAAHKKVLLEEKYAALNDVHARFEEDSGDAFLDEDDLDREVEAVFDGVENAEVDAVDGSASMLTTAVQTLGESVKFYVGQAFGIGADDDADDDDSMLTSPDVTLSEEQLDLIAEKISERLDRAVKQEFRAKADGVREEKMNEIHAVVAEDRAAHMKARDIQRDVHEAQTVVLEDLRDEIDDAAARVKDDIPNKLQQIRNEVVKEVTGENLANVIKRKELRKERTQQLINKFNEMKAQTASAGVGGTKDRSKGGPKGSVEVPRAGQKRKETKMLGRVKRNEAKESGQQATQLKGTETRVQGGTEGTKAKEPRQQVTKLKGTEAGAKGGMKGSKAKEEMQQFDEMQANARSAMRARYGPEAREKMEPGASAAAGETMKKFLQLQMEDRNKTSEKLGLPVGQEAGSQGGREVAKEAEDPMKQFDEVQARARTAVMAQYGPEAREEMEPAASAAAKEAMVEFLKQQALAKVSMRAKTMREAHAKQFIEIQSKGGDAAKTAPKAVPKAALKADAAGPSGEGGDGTGGEDSNAAPEDKASA